MNHSFIGYSRLPVKIHIEGIHQEDSCPSKGEKGGFNHLDIGAENEEGQRNGGKSFVNGNCRSIEGAENAESNL